MRPNDLKNKKKFFDMKEGWQEKCGNPAIFDQWNGAFFACRSSGCPKAHRSRAPNRGGGLKLSDPFHQ
jgi:hypothetical protein